MKTNQEIIDYINYLSATTNQLVSNDNEYGNGLIDGTNSICEQIIDFIKEG